MLRPLWVTLIYLAFIILGVAAPFAFSLGYVWVDTFTPQNVVQSIITQIPVSMIMAVLALGSYFMLDRRSPPPVSWQLVLVLLFAAWVTITTAAFAVVPASAWEKWDWAVKTLLFSAFIPFIIRSRVQIEAFLQIYVFSLAVHVVPVGLKTILSGGGYGRSLGIVHGNSGMAEGSMLAAVALMMLPILLFLRQHTLLVPKNSWTSLIYIGFAVITVTCAIGTYARTGMIGMAVVGIALWLRSRHKLLFGVIGVGALLGVMAFTTDAWNSRMSTVATFQSENSAFGRVLIWRWTLGFVAERPMGGGFQAFEINEIRYPSPPGSEQPEIVERGRAFHSIYFEILGEHGWPGLALFLGLVLTSFLNFHRVARWARRTEGMEWLRDLAYALEVSLVTLLACGAFIGIGFQPMLYYMFALSTCLAHQMHRLRQADTVTRQVAGAGAKALAVRSRGRDGGSLIPPPVGAKRS